MDVIINGQPHQVRPGLSLADAVSLVASQPAGLAAAVNGEVAARASWASVTLGPGDVVEVVTATQGG